VSLRRTLLFSALTLLILFSVWNTLAQEREAAEKAEVTAAAIRMVNSVLTRNIQACKAYTDFPVVLIEGISGRSAVVKGDNVEEQLDKYYVPSGPEVEVQKAEVLLMGKTASVQIELAVPEELDVGLSNRCAFLLVKKDGKWKVKAVAYYGY